MTTVEQAEGLVGSGLGLLDKERTIAKAGFNRWLVPPAALCIHLCIGMAYGFSVFWLPLSRALGTAAQSCPDITFFQEAFTTTCSWRIASMGWIFVLFFVVLGVSAAIWGGWLERVGPRKAGVVAAICWGGGLLISAAVWALSSHSGNYHHASAGRRGTIIAAVAALLVGAAPAIIAFFQDLGATVN